MMQQVNLYHPIFRRQQKKFSAVALLQATGIVVAGVVVLVGLNLWQINALRVQLAHTEQEVTSAIRQLEQVRAQAASIPRELAVENELRVLEQQLSALAAASQLSEQGSGLRAQGYADHLLAFARQHLDGVWLRGVTIEGEQIALEGSAVDPEYVPRYLQRLAREPQFTGARFQTVKITRVESERGPKKPTTVEFIIESKPEVRQ